MGRYDRTFFDFELYGKNCPKSVYKIQQENHLDGTFLLGMDCKAWLRSMGVRGASRLSACCSFNVGKTSSFRKLSISV